MKNLELFVRKMSEEIRSLDEFIQKQKAIKYKVLSKGEQEALRNRAIEKECERIIIEHKVKK